MKVDKESDQGRYTLYEQENGHYKQLLLIDEDIRGLYFRNYYKTKTHVLFVFDFSLKKDQENIIRVAQIFYRTTIKELEANVDNTAYKEEPLIHPNSKDLYTIFNMDLEKF